jgi:hypothetical protein
LLGFREITFFIETAFTLQKELFELEENIGGCCRPKKIVARQCKLLQLLLNKKVTTFKFPPHLTSKHQDSVSQLWQSLLVERPPDLNTLICENHQCWNIGAFIEQMLPVFPTLQVVKLDSFECDDST